MSCLAHLTRLRSAVLTIVLAFTLTGVHGQTNKVWSFAPDLTVLLNKEGNVDYGFGYAIDHSGSNIEFGLAALRRHYFITPSQLSYEYGLRLQKAYLGLRVTSPSTTQPTNITLDRLGASIPLRLFYGGKGAFTDRRSRQSGLFAELLLSGYTGDDLPKNVYTSHLSLGARTRGRRLYFQLAFGWPLLATETRFIFEEQGFAFPNRERRYNAVTVGYQLNN